MHGLTGADEPDLVLTNDREPIASGNTGNNEAIAYMGILDTLTQDAEAFANCIIGPGTDVNEACYCPDVDDDSDVDIIDFAWFQAAVICAP